MSSTLPQVRPSLIIPRNWYINVLSLFFICTALSFPIQILFLQDRSGTWQDWLDIPLELTALNWLCMISYVVSAAALQKKWSKIWSFLGLSFLITAINNCFLAFVGWDYSVPQLLFGTLAMAIPMAPLYFMPGLRHRFQRGHSLLAEEPAPRFKKRWRVEILSAGEDVPTSGVTLNISHSGALVHWFDKDKINGKAIDLRLTDALDGHILDCKAQAVRREKLKYGSKPFPVMGVQFVDLTEDQKDILMRRLK